MALRNKRYVEEGRNAPPVSVPPTEAAKLPEPAVDAKPPEPMAESTPADEAGRAALKQRLKEMENAELLTRAAVSHPQPPPQLQEPQEPQQPTLEQAIAHLPERVQRWYKAHPEFLTNPEKAAQIQYMHHVAAREVGEQFTDPYYDRMEQMLGLRARPQPSNGNGAPTLAPRNAEPLSRPQQRNAVPMSAPPHRDPPLMSTGRAASRPTQLTADQLEMARASGITAEEYQRQLEKMNRMKAAGELDDRRR
jgi:hypothetical protein